MCIAQSDPALTHVLISNNTAGFGGGLHLYWFSNPTLTHVKISNNIAQNEGGGILSLYSGFTLTHVSISGNHANYGAGMFLSNTTYINWLYPDLTLTHVTIAHNTASDGGGMYLSDSNPSITNSIIKDNTPNSFSIDYGTPTISYSNIEGATGNFNIDLDPLFTDPDNGDYTLLEDSPCIDAGTVIEDMEYCGEAPDMGAYEYCEDLSVASETHLPIHNSLNSAYPNPFNPVTSIAYSLPQNGNVELIVYNIQGRQVQTLVDNFHSAGYHSINWNATSYPSGVYLIRMESGEFTQTQKVVLVK